MRYEYIVYSPWHPENVDYWNYSNIDHCPTEEEGILAGVWLPLIGPTEYITGMSQPELARRWLRLSFNRHIPPGIPLAQAVAEIEAIWLLWWYNKDEISYPVRQYLWDALTDKPDRILTWKKVIKLAKEDGLDYQTDAYCEGVPLEFILSE